MESVQDLPQSESESVHGVSDPQVVTQSSGYSEHEVAIVSRHIARLITQYSELFCWATTNARIRPMIAIERVTNPLPIWCLYAG